MMTPGRTLKIAIELPKVREIVWTEVLTWRRSKGKAVLLDSPIHVKMKSGSKVKFTPDMIMDYTLSDPEHVIESGGVDAMVKQMR